MLSPALPYFFRAERRRFWDDRLEECCLVGLASATGTIGSGSVFSIMPGSVALESLAVFSFAEVLPDPFRLIPTARPAAANAKKIGKNPTQSVEPPLSLLLSTSPSIKSFD